MIIALSNRSFASNSELSSQIGHIEVLMHDSRKWNIPLFCSYISKGLVSYVLSDENQAYANCLDIAVALQDELGMVLRPGTHIALLSYLETSEERLMIDFPATFRDYERGKLMVLTWVLWQIGLHAPSQKLDSPICCMTSGTLRDFAKGIAVGVVRVKIIKQKIEKLQFIRHFDASQDGIVVDLSHHRKNSCKYQFLFVMVTLLLCALLTTLYTVKAKHLFFQRPKFHPRCIVVTKGCMSVFI